MIRSQGNINYLKAKIYEFLIKLKLRDYNYITFKYIMNEKQTLLTYKPNTKNYVMIEYCDCSFPFTKSDPRVTSYVFKNIKDAYKHFMW